MEMPRASAGAAKRLEALVGEEPRVRLRKMFGQPAAFANGNLCVGVFGADLFVRLSEEDVRTLAKAPGVRRFEPMPGRPMKQYLVLPAAMLQKTAEARKWVARSFEYSLSLPPT